MKHILLLLFSLFSFLSVSAQKLDISILNFEMDQFDTSAQAGTQYAEYDKGGELYSIIKVKDAEGDNIPDGFTFDFGTVRTLKHEIHDGDLWVWVQRNAKTVTIRHPEYRTIEKYDLGQTIQPGRVYVMRVTMSRIERVVKTSVRKQLLQFQVTPADKQALVRVKGIGDADFELWGKVDEGGNITRFMPFGVYDYFITAKDYDESFGRVTLSDANATFVENVTLTPNYGLLEVVEQNGLEGAEIFVNDESIGTTPYRDSSRFWAPGQYRIEVVGGDLYRPYSSNFTITKGETTCVTSKLEGDFANISLVVVSNAQIAIDGKRVGNGSWSGPLKAGQHIVTCSLPNHRDASQTINVKKDKSESIQLTSPTPITGTMVIISNPSGATITIDGKPAGTTPKAFPELLIGHHSIELSRDGYVSEKREVTIAESDEQQFEVVMEEFKGVKIGEKYYDVNANGTITFEVKGVKFKMVLVKHGTFQMGSTTVDSDETPVHRVKISKDYYIGETEVTQALWKAVTGYSPTSDGNAWSSSIGVGDNYPAYYINYEDVQDFITKLNEMTGQKFRMPTEAEWEYAAKGGNKSKGYTYSGSNTIDDVAWYRVNSYDKGYSSPDFGTHPVKTKSPNELGIYDMSGNVIEWCSDYYGHYKKRAVKDPIGLIGDGWWIHVTRGGGWYASAEECRSASRGTCALTSREMGIGFRLAL